MKNIKKFLPILLIALVIIPVGIFAFTRGDKTEPEAEAPAEKKRVTKPVNQISAGERPYVEIAPTANREVDVIVHRVPKDATEVEFLAEYQYGTSLGGNENLIDLATLPATEQFALYSRSAGGKTSYEEDVKGGTMTLKFQGPEEYWLKQDWNYYDRVNAKSSTQESALTSRDGKFNISGTSVNPLRYVVIYNSPGYPTELPGTALSEVYTFQYAGTPSGDSAEVSIRMNSEGSGSIYGWDGEALTPFETEIDGKEATATVEIMDAYVVVSE